jgi:transposase InsO family protein
MVSPSARKIAVDVLKQEHGYSERKGCALVEVSRTAVRRTPSRKPDEEALRERIVELAGTKKRYGCRMVTVLLRREGWHVNKKRVHRIWKQQGLSLPRKRPRRRRCGRTVEIIHRAAHKNHVWTYDFVEDRTESGSKLRLLVVLDEYTRRCLRIRVERSMPAAKVVDTLNWLFLLHGVPEHIRSDNGPEFIAIAVCDWLANAGCNTIFIKPGSPWENPFIESFNRTLRNECLNREIFTSPREAQHVVENWRCEYNEFRPHSSLGYLTPAQFTSGDGSSSSLRFHRKDKSKTKSKGKDKILTF